MILSPPCPGQSAKNGIAAGRNNSTNLVCTLGTLIQSRKYTIPKKQFKQTQKGVLLWQKYNKSVALVVSAGWLG